MLIPENKIYCDGSHYIAIPHTTRPKQGRKKKPEVKVDTSNGAKPPTKKEIFDELYKESMNKPKSERKESLVKSMREQFDSDEQTKEFVEQQLERKKRNAMFAVLGYFVKCIYRFGTGFVRLLTMMLNITKIVLGNHCLIV